jgi:hypothetical protein
VFLAFSCEVTGTVDNFIACGVVQGFLLSHVLGGEMALGLDGHIFA